jgi:predicted nucleic acid-binding Zn ribbon protein
MSTDPPRGLRRASDVIERTLKRLGLSQGVRAHRAFEIWEAAVGPQVAAHARPERISNRVLRVEVDHNTWLQQLHFMKALILSRLNDRLGEGTLIDIDLRLGRPKPLESEAPRPAPPPSVRLPLAPDAAARIEEQIASLRDDDLRALFRRMVEKGTRRR